MKFYDVSRPFYLETNLSGVGLGAGILQVSKGMNYGCNEVPNIFVQLCSPAKAYLVHRGKTAILQWEALEILHGLQKFCHYCFAKEVCVITDHKPLVANISRIVPMLSQHLQCIMLCVH